MTELRARIGRFEAPVDYGAMHQWLQHVRGGAALMVAVACATGLFFGATEAWLPGSVAIVTASHALWRSTRPHSVTEVLVIDAIAITVGMGVGQHAQPALIAAAAYLIAASITFGGLESLFWALTAFGGAIAVRPLLPLPNPDALPAAGDVVGWITVAALLGGVALALMASATEVFKARGVQAAALEAERRAAEVKTEFVSMVTHELRTPLTNIAGFADTLKDTWQELPQEDIDEFLKIVVAESQHLGNLVEDVLAIPRLEAGRLLLDNTDFQLQPAAFKVVDLLFPDTSERSASVSVGSNVVLHADPNRVEQVLRNLVENARKYGGDSVSVEAIPLGDDWQVVVSDNGTGLSGEDRERVFEAFEQVTSFDTRTEGGFGLGLAVARHLVVAMGGRIWYEPGFPVGARFCFTLPAGQIAGRDEAIGNVA